MHIHKTAGTTFRDIIERQSPEQFFRYYPNDGLDKAHFQEQVATQPKKFPVIYGHFGYELADQLQGQQQWCTFLRNPLGQSLSLYHHICKVPERFSFERPPASAEALYALPEFTNYQTKFILGAEQAHLKDTSEGLWLASQRLLNFFFVGLTEQFTPSLLLLRELLKNAQPAFLQRHLYFRSLNRQMTQRTDEKAVLQKRMEALPHTHGNDLALYALGEALFHQRVAAYPNFQRMLKAFERRNQLYACYHQLRYRDVPQ